MTRLLFVETQVAPLERNGGHRAEPVREGFLRRRRASLLTFERFIRFALGVGVVLVVGWLVWYFSELLIYLLIGVVLAYLVRPLVDRLQGFGVGRIPAILLTFVLVGGGLTLLLTYLVPFVAAQLAELSQQVSPEAITEVAESVERRVESLIPIQEGSIVLAVDEAMQTLFQSERITQVVGSMVDLFTDIFYAVIIIPFVMFFVLKDGSLIRRSLLRLVPNRYFEVTLGILEKIETNIGRYFRGLLLQCIAVAVVATVALYVFGIRYALAVGIFTGLANSIPYFGPLMGFLAGTLVGIAQTGDFSLVVGVLIAMALTQLADNVLFQPLIFSRAARTHPLVILFVVLIGAQLAGIIGMLVAIPLTTVLRVTVEQVLWSLRNYRILQTSR